MIRGLYTSGWSMLALNKKMDVIANNMANVNTAGYKKDTVIFEAFPEILTKRINDTASSLNPSGRIGSMELSGDVGEVFTYYRQGQLIRTDNTFDLAIRDSGTAFFTLQSLDENGNAREYYTRDGQFSLNSGGRLVSSEGYGVMGENGPVLLKGDSFSVMEDGTIIQDGEAVDRLLIKDFANPGTLRKIGSNLAAATAETVEKDFDGTVEQGFYEQSNVDIVREMVDMITVMRAYEANQKMIQAHDSTLERAVNEVGNIR